MVPLHASDTLTRARPSRKAGFQIDRVTEDDGLSGVNACFADWHGGAHLRDRKQHRKKNLFTKKIFATLSSSVELLRVRMH